MTRCSSRFAVAVASLAAVAPVATAQQSGVGMAGMDHGAMTTGKQVAMPNDHTLPADAAHATARLNASPRHGEYVMIATSPSSADSIRAWVVYPERRTKAPVVLVVHEIFGLSTWIRAVADQLASEGFIAIAPDLLSTQHLAPPSPSDTMPTQDIVAAISRLNPDDVQRQLDAVARYGMALPAALPKYGIVGFCWGGGVSFQHAVHSPTLGASVVFYGTSPKTESLSAVHAPVLGNYAGEDARVDMTSPPADSALHAMGRTYDHYIYAGAGHGFLRQQDGKNGANLAATRESWPRTVAWFKEYLGT